MGNWNRSVELNFSLSCYLPFIIIVKRPFPQRKYSTFIDRPLTFTLDWNSWNIFALKLWKMITLTVGTRKPFIFLIRCSLCCFSRNLPNLCMFTNVLGPLAIRFRLIFGHLLGIIGRIFLFTRYKFILMNVFTVV